MNGAMKEKKKLCGLFDVFGVFHKHTLDANKFINGITMGQ